VIGIVFRAPGRDNGGYAMFWFI